MAHNYLLIKIPPTPFRPLFFCVYRKEPWQDIEDCLLKWQDAVDWNRGNATWESGRVFLDALHSEGIADHVANLYNYQVPEMRSGAPRLLDRLVDYFDDVGDYARNYKELHAHDNKGLRERVTRPTQAGVAVVESGVAPCSDVPQLAVATD